MTFEKLKVRTRKELAAMAKRHQVTGWHGMKKDELIEALLSMHSGRKKTRSTKSDATSSREKSASASRSRQVTRRSASANGNSRKVLNGASKAQRDKLVAQACDPWWILARWEITPGMIDRAEAALASDWHRAVPVIRIYDVTRSDLDTVAKSFLKDIEIHGEVDHWFIPVDKPAQQLKLQIGYRTASGKFFAMARSNMVCTPSPGTRGRVSLNGKKNSKNGSVDEEFHIREIHETRPATITFLAEKMGAGKIIDDSQEFPFNMEAELIVYGSADPRCEFSLMGEDVPVSEDGSFSVRFHLPNGRQVIPAVTVTPDGSETRTIVMAIERNTKELEPQLLDEMTP